MQEAGLIPKDIDSDKEEKIIKKITKLTSGYNYNKSDNFIKRAVRFLLHYIGVKYVGKKEARSILSKINLPSSRGKDGSRGR